MIWIAGAIFNLAVTRKMLDPYGWLTTSPVPPWRWLFRKVVVPHPQLWTVLLALCELVLGVLTLGGGPRARVGLAGGAVFSAFLLSLATPYTLMMGPYAAILAWLARKDYRSIMGRRS
jgi:hypothetical protein